MINVSLQGFVLMFFFLFLTKGNKNSQSLQWAGVVDKRWNIHWGKRIYHYCVIRL